MRFLFSCNYLNMLKAHKNTNVVRCKDIKLTLPVLIHTFISVSTIISGRACSLVQVIIGDLKHYAKEAYFLCAVFFFLHILPST